MDNAYGAVSAVPVTITTELRRVERICPDQKQWARVSMSQVVPGDVVRMFEPDGHPVATTTGRTEFKVIGAPREQDGVWGVECE